MPLTAVHACAAELQCHARSRYAVFAMHQWLRDVAALGWTLRTSHVFLLLAAAVCSWHGGRQLRAADPIGWRRARPGLLLLAVVPWIGGHFHFLVNNWAYAAAHPSVVFLPWMGLHAGGAMMALACSAPLVLHRYGLPLGRVVDTLVPTVGIGIVLGRLGCFAEGCCFGRRCQWPWCVSFPRGTNPYELHLALGFIDPAAPYSAPVHPLQLYFAAVGIVLIMLSRWLHPRRRYEGQVGLVGIGLFSVAAAVLEPLRADHDARVYWGPLPQLQWTALAMAAASLLALYMAERRSRRGPQSPALGRPPADGDRND